MWELLRRAGLRILDHQIAPADITGAAKEAHCPVCGSVSRRRHSSYTRLLMDVPADGRTVSILLSVRRFRCVNRQCRRRVFVAERFPQLVRSRARRTERLDTLLTRIGVFLGGQGGGRLLRSRLGRPARTRNNASVISGGWHSLNTLCAAGTRAAITLPSCTGKFAVLDTKARERR